MSEAIEPQARCCRSAARDRAGRRPASWPILRDAVFREPRLQRRACAADHADWLVAQERDSLRRTDHREAAWLVQLARELGEELVAGEADGNRDADLVFDPLRQRGHCLRRATAMQLFGARKIEIGLVERQWLDQRRQVAHHRSDALALGDIFRHLRLDHRRMWTKLQRLEHRHRRAHAVDAGDIAAGRDHPALAAADDHGLVGQRRIVALLDRRVKRVAIQMCDGELVQFRMRDDAMAAALLASRRAIRDIAKAIAAERAHFSGHSHAAPRTPLESPWRFFRIAVGPCGEKA